MSTLTASSTMEIAKGGISGRSPEVQPQRLIQRSVMAHSKAFQIPQALAAAQDPEHPHHEQKTFGKAHPVAHPSIGYRLQKTDQVAGGIGRKGF